VNADSIPLHVVEHASQIRQFLTAAGPASSRNRVGNEGDALRHRSRLTLER
jgi:hypothetical protein